MLPLGIKSGTHQGSMLRETCSEVMMEGQFSTSGMPVFAKKISLAWNSAGLNSCAMKQGRNDNNFNVAMCALLVQTVSALSHGYAKIQGVSLGFRCPQQVPLCVTTFTTEMTAIKQYGYDAA